MKRLQRPAGIGRLAQVAKPGAGLLCQLRHEGPAVAGIGERHLVMAVVLVRPGNGATGQLPGADQWRCDLAATTVTLGLPELAGDIEVFLLGFDDRDGRQAVEQQIIGATLLGGPFGNGTVGTLLRPRTFAVGQCLGVGLPASFDQMLVDENAREVFAQHDLLAGAVGALVQSLTPLGDLRIALRRQLLLQGLDLLFIFGALRGERLFLGGSLLTPGPDFFIHGQGQGFVFAFLAADEFVELLAGIDLNARLLQLMAQLLDLGLQAAQLLAGVRGRDESAWLESSARLAEGLVKPHRQSASDLEAVERFLVAGTKLVGGSVPLDPQGME